jgi:hypothetical protein
VTRLSSYGPRARAEFRRLLLESQIDRGEAELAARRSRNQRYRSRRVERRLAALRTLLRELEGAQRFPAPSWLRSRTAGALVSLLWVAGAAALAVDIVVRGVGAVTVTVGVIAMLAVSLLWFALAVARVPLSEDPGVGTPPSRPERHA